MDEMVLIAMKASKSRSIRIEIFECENQNPTVQYGRYNWLDQIFGLINVIYLRNL